MRSAPSGGYDFSRKRDYRRKVWATFRDRLKSRHISIAESHALLMPSLEGDEIDVALNAGFREWNLHVVDEEPAIVATLKKKYRRINTYGVKASRAMERMRRDGVRLSCANLDLCGQVSAGICQELGQAMAIGHGYAERWGEQNSVPPKVFTGRGVFADYSMVAVTLLRGRENGNTAASWRANTDYTDGGLESQADEIDVELAQYGGSMFEWRDDPESLFAHMRNVSKFDRSRLACLMSLLRCDLPGWKSLIKPAIHLERTESYVSTNGQSMLWSIWTVLSPAETVASAMRLNALRKLSGLGEYGPEMFR